MKYLLIALFMTLLSACGGASPSATPASLKASYSVTWTGHAVVLKDLNLMQFGAESPIPYSVDGSECRADGTLNQSGGNWYSLRVRNAVAISGNAGDTFNCSRMDELHSPLQNPVFYMELTDVCSSFQQVGT